MQKVFNCVPFHISVALKPTSTEKKKWIATNSNDRHSQLPSFCVIFQPVNAQIFMIQFFTVIFWHFIWHAIWQCCCWLGNGICCWLGTVYTARELINCTSLALFIHWMAYKHMSFEKTICNMLYVQSVVPTQYGVLCMVSSLHHIDQFRVEDSSVLYVMLFLELWTNIIYVPILLSPIRFYKQMWTSERALFGSDVFICKSQCHTSHNSWLFYTVDVCSNVCSTYFAQ